MKDTEALSLTQECIPLVRKENAAAILGQERSSQFVTLEVRLRTARRYAIDGDQDMLAHTLASMAASLLIMLEPLPKIK